MVILRKRTGFNMKDTFAELKTIKDKKLLDFITHDSNDRKTVIAEMELPVPKIEKQQISRISGMRKQLVRAKPLSMAEKADIEKKTIEYRAFLHKLPLTEIIPLEGAYAFIVTVTPQQLRKIAKFPLTKTVFPSRTHKIIPER